MVIFRIVEKVGINRYFKNDLLQYVITVILVIGGSTVLSIIIKKMIKTISKRMEYINIKI